MLNSNSYARPSIFLINSIDKEINSEGGELSLPREFGSNRDSDVNFIHSIPSMAMAKILFNHVGLESLKNLTLTAITSVAIVALENRESLCL